MGYEQHLRMYPLTLREFFDAIGQNDQTLELVRERMRNREPIPTAIHERLLRAFSLYMVVGGMPAAVERFNETSDLSHVLLCSRISSTCIGKISPNTGTIGPTSR